MEAVKQRGLALRHVKEQTYEICLKWWVNQDGHALQYVKEQTEEICFAAIRNTVCSLQFARKQIEEFCLEAVKQNIYSLKYVNTEFKFQLNYRYHSLVNNYIKF